MAAFGNKGLKDQIGAASKKPDFFKTVKSGSIPSGVDVNERQASGFGFTQVVDRAPTGIKEVADSKSGSASERLKRKRLSGGANILTSKANGQTRSKSLLGG